MIPDVRIEDYSYPLPEDRIAKYPLPRRDASKLLVYKDGSSRESLFRNLSDFLPEGALMIFNNTKVVPARMHFIRDTGARIEIFCLEPFNPAEYNSSFASERKCSWKCVIGNSKRWKGDILHYDLPEDSAHAIMNLTARLVSRDGQTGIVEFAWEGGCAFSQVLEECAQVPIPPYLNRETEAVDLERYQTLYAQIRGSVAAPTAGLHFTEEVLEDIRGKNIDTQNVYLHVGTTSGSSITYEKLIDIKEFPDIGASHASRSFLGESRPAQEAPSQRGPLHSRRHYIGTYSGISLLCRCFDSGKRPA